MAGLTLLTASILPGCADDNFSAPQHGDEVQLNFAVAETPLVATRASMADNYISDITVLVYNPSDKLIYRQDIAHNSSFTNGSSFTTSVKLTDIREVSGNLTFYALTNCKDKLNDVSVSGSKKSISDLKGIEDNLGGSYISMSSKVVSTATDVTSKTFELNRNIAKWDVIKHPEHNIEPRFDISEFKVGNIQTTTFLTAAADNIANGAGQTTTVTASFGEVAYVAPKENASDVYFLIHASYNDQDGWYKVAMANDFKIRPNYHYQVQIMSVEAPGFATEAEAVAAAPVNMEAKVVEHCPEIYSLTSTGTHTLGTPDVINLSNSEEIESDILIKTICKESASCSITTLPVVEVIDGSDWISITGSAVATTATDDSPEDSKGNFYKQTITVKPLVGGNERTGKVRVKWGELTRVVEICQTGVFNGAALGNFAISTLDDPSGNQSEMEYWTAFLENAVVGVDEKAMCGEIRNHGLHFPIGLQKSATDAQLTKYSYTLSNIVEEYQGTYEISLKANSKFNGNLMVDGQTLSSNNSLTGTFTAATKLVFSLKASSWNYLCDKDALIIKVTKDGKTVEFSYDLYQTGFFYKPGNETHRLDGASTNGKYLYYEVIQTTVNGKTYYWLDRNVGATAAGMYIEDAMGLNAMEDADSPFINGSQGGLYAISKEDSKTLDSEIVPPGFRVPTASEFTQLTSSSIFKTVSEKAPGNNKTYWTSYFADSNSSRKIYFPKNRMIQSSGIKAGDGNTGYYWTRTEAVGASGSEVGKWWQAVKISGGSASIVRYRRAEDGASGFTGLSIRPVRNTSVVEEVESYKLRVKGYTHVYLYTVDETGTRVPLTSWPGEQVTTYSGCTGSNANNYYDFDYTSYVKYDNVYIILNKVNGNTVEASWFKSSGVANPGSMGMIPVKDPWTIRTDVPTSEIVDNNSNQFYIYWRKKDNNGYDYNMLNIVDGTNTIVRNGVNYASNGNYYYVTYTTKSSSIRVQPRHKSGNEDWTLNRTEDNGADRLWTVTTNGNGKIDDSYHFTIVSYDNDATVSGDKNYYGKPR